MDIQQALLSKIIHDTDIVTAVNARITPEFFGDDRWRRIYEWLLDHWRQYGTPPDLNATAHAFPNYTWPNYGNSIHFFINGLRQRRKRVILTEAMTQAAQFLSAANEPDAMDLMEGVIREALSKIRLETAPTLDIDLYRNAEEFLAIMEERELDPSFLRGISTGIRGIDYVTGGLQPEQFIVIIGLPKSMKSSTLLYIAMAVHRQVKVPLFIGFEMSNMEQQERIVSLLAAVRLTDVLTGNLSWRDHTKIARELKARVDTPPFILSSDLDSATTVSGVQAKILEYQPDAVFIDGAYLMHSEIPKVEQGSAQALTDIARELKKLAQSQRIPIIVTTQASESRSRGGKLNAASAMYTQAWRQSADVMLGTERVDQDASDNDEVQVRFKVLASRSGPRAETTLAWNWNAGTVAELDTAYFAKRQDDGDDV